MPLIRRLTIISYTNKKKCYQLNWHLNLKDVKMEKKIPKISELYGILTDDNC